MKVQHERQLKKCTSPRRFDCYRKCLLEHLWLVILVTLVCTTSANLCTRPGETSRHYSLWDSPPIILESDDPLTILCMLDEMDVDSKYPGSNASNLFFRQNDSEVDQKYISIVNENTIKLHVERPTPGPVYCMLWLGYNTKMLCMRVVTIGSKPQKPKNFNCTSYDWTQLECTWEPIPNNIETKYSLSFRLPGAKREKLFRCSPKNSNKCIWNVFLTPQYFRNKVEYFSFELHVENALGSAVFHYNFHHYGHVIPAKPPELTVVSRTYESAMLYWFVSDGVYHFPPGLHHRIAYQVQWTNTWKVINITSDIHKQRKHFNLTGLYPNTFYEVRVSMKSAVAPEEGGWGEYIDVLFKTLLNPALPPSAQMGNVKIVDNSTIVEDDYGQCVLQCQKTSKKYRPSDSL